ncbi:MULTISPECIES: DUF4255 domain-containing protein [unclassified Agarivorans]|uniref:DUF4255 domain-containing protein n=1 Tax=unclassified Agarivorans TaxID=2636026 RepID=UPI0026E36E27|nr:MULTISPECIES: DUF4255 domain-containing protein [unclassified Agarivorans]MDO6686762.1 DUF4255 domain-containing protein [Agarivorans sp. 3_MG-2023]MDO6716508.1 DUF4255 domain-containing protein [Agarivorans sp. 2_MG-2023]
MIGEALNLTTTLLNEHLARRFELDEDMAVLSNVQDVAGKAQSSCTNKMVLSLVSIEKDPAYVNSKQGVLSGAQAYSKQALHLNLYVLLAANFENERYQHGLRLLSECAEFYHHQSVFDRSNCPTLPNNIDKLVWEIENLNLSEQSHVWSLLGKHCQPSIFYKVRAIPLDTSHISGRLRPATTPASDVGGL